MSQLMVIVLIGVVGLVVCAAVAWLGFPSDRRKRADDASGATVGEPSAIDCGAGDAGAGCDGGAGA